MKILLVCNYFQPQFTYAESEVAKSLLLQGHKVEVITSDRYFPFPNFDSTVKKILKKRIVGVGERIERGINVSRKKVYVEFFARAVYFGINNKIKEYKPDIIICFGLTTPANIQVALAKNGNTFRYIGVDSHLPSELFSSNIFVKKIFYFCFRLLFSWIINSKIDKIIAAQEGTKEVIEKYYGLSKNIVIISHGTDVQLYKHSKKLRRELRERYQITKSDFVIIYTGKLIESKGINILTMAFAQLAQNYDNIFLLLVGSGTEEYKNKCLNSVPQKFQNRIIWVGLIPFQKLPAYYSSSDVAVWPLQESLSMNDAAASSLPFIVNDTVGVLERISNNNALLYKKGNYNDLASKIEILYLNLNKRKTMGKNGRTLVEKNLSWEKVAQRYIS
jgi:glycosyltransferase involved in cell wall biosynthesis